MKIIFAVAVLVVMLGSVALAFTELPGTINGLEFNSFVLTDDGDVAIRGVSV